MSEKICKCCGQPITKPTQGIIYYNTPENSTTAYRLKTIAEAHGYELAMEHKPTGSVSIGWVEESDLSDKVRDVLSYMLRALDELREFAATQE